MGVYLLKKFSVKRLTGLGMALVIVYALIPLRFAVNYDYIPNDKIHVNLVPVTTFGPSKNSCPELPETRIYEILPSNCSDYDQIEYAESLKIQKGGIWKPDLCKYIYNTAIIVPFRERTVQLKTFLHHIHPFLQKQFISYRVFVIEQTKLKPFNRGSLMNIGFLEALKIYPFGCFIFHDVDLLPLVHMNMYACTYKPRHLCSAINTWRYKLKYSTAFGGAVAILQKDFNQINGFSNEYYGWGGEDDDLIKRILHNNLGYCRFSPEVSKYFMLHHKTEKKNPKRVEILKNAHNRFTTDGISSLNYTKLHFNEEPLYTHILVDI